MAMMANKAEKSTMIKHECTVVGHRGGQRDVEGLTKENQIKVGGKVHTSTSWFSAVVLQHWFSC